MQIPQISAILGAIFQGLMYIAVAFILVLYVSMSVALLREYSNKIKNPKSWKEDDERRAAELERQLGRRSK
ncbi:MAG: hypothetical protein IJB97_06070 [Clostridia bacterium]|nr:hypothetical protein [Clostridia bacterium]